MGTYPDAPGHRNVETSIAAADALAPKLGRLQRMAEGAIRDAGAHGLTADELAARLDMDRWRSEEHTSELQSLMRISYAVFCLKKQNNTPNNQQPTTYEPHTYHTQHCRHTHELQTSKQQTTH